MGRSAKEKRGRLQFVEIEHKFVIDKDFDLSSFFRQVKKLGPKKDYKVAVKDKYFTVQALPSAIIRHRYDKKIQQLTLKNLADDAEIRQEINLDLGHNAGEQSEQVKAFLTPLGITWSGTLTKLVRVFYFDDAEIVHYVARHKRKSVSCIEIEATRFSTKTQALNIIRRYERILGLNERQRSSATLFEILMLPHIKKAKL